MPSQIDSSDIYEETLVDSLQFEIEIPNHYVHVHNVTCPRAKGGALGK